MEPQIKAVIGQSLEEGRPEEGAFRNREEVAGKPKSFPSDLSIGKALRSSL
jgi:hypothetical protein